MTKILLVDYDVNTNYTIKNDLEYEENRFCVLIASNGEEAITLWEEQLPDVIVCNIDFREINPLDLASQIRQKDKDVLILFFALNASSKDILTSYESGMTFFIRCPFTSRELAAHIVALLKLKNGHSVNRKTNFIKIGCMELDVDKCRLICKNQPDISLTTREVKILLLLCEKRKEVVPRNEILSKIWGTKEGDDYYASRSLDVFIAKLRKKMSIDSSVVIKTIKNVGIVLE